MTTCPRCDAPVLAVIDSFTAEEVLVDRKAVHGGRVELKRTPVGSGGLVAIDHITTPAPRQPAWELHSRTCTSPPPAPVINLDDDPVRERSGGWRR